MRGSVRSWLRLDPVPRWLSNNGVLGSRNSGQLVGPDRVRTVNCEAIADLVAEVRPRPEPRLVSSSIQRPEALRQALRLTTHRRRGELPLLFRRCCDDADTVVERLDA